MEDLLQIYKNGGLIMHIILLISLIGVAIVIEKLRFLIKANSVKKEEILNQINSYILQGDLERAITVTSQAVNPLTNIVRSGLIAVSNGGDVEEVQTAMDATALRDVPLIEKRIGLLVTLSNLATLLGLLGTISGLINAFASVASAAPAEKASLLASAISQAMNTTAFGLLVAIPLLGAYGYLNSMAQDLISHIHELSVSTLNFILKNKSHLKSHVQK